MTSELMIKKNSKYRHLFSINTYLLITRVIFLNEMTDQFY